MTVTAETYEPPRRAADAAALSIGAAIALIVFDVLLTTYTALATIDLAPALALSWDDVDRGETAGIVLYAVALLFAAVTFIRWQRILVRNAKRFSDGVEVDESWAVASWFIPIVQLIAPLRVFRRIVGATEPPSSATGALLNVWWMSWVLAAIIGGYANVIIGRAFELDRWLHAAAFDFTSSALRITAGVLAILVLKRLTELQERTAQGLALSPSIPVIPTIQLTPTRESSP